MLLRQMLCRTSVGNGFAINLVPDSRPVDADERGRPGRVCGHELRSIQGARTALPGLPHTTSVPGCPRPVLQLEYKPLRA